MLRVLKDHHMLPNDYLALDDRSKAFIIASYNLMDKWDEEAREREERM